MHHFIALLCFVAGLIALAFGLIWGIHETAWVGFALLALCACIVIVDAVLVGLFKRLDAWLYWKHGIKTSSEPVPGHRVTRP